MIEKSLNKIVIAILSGKDHRPYVLETINQRFLETVRSILVRVFEARKRNEDDDWWLRELISIEQDKKEVLWFSGLNNKTVQNMMRTTRKEICVDLGRQNLKTIQTLISELSSKFTPTIEITIRYEGQQLKLSEVESLLLINTIATMKLSIQGGAWSEVGKKVEKRLLFTIFEMLSIPQSQYILVFDEMKRRGFVSNREIDAIVFTDDKQQVLRIELKLLGIGNPEIGDEALAREVDLFLTDGLTNMMVEEAKKRSITTIELRDVNALKRIYEFFLTKGVSVRPADTSSLEQTITQIGQQYDETRENLAILRKVKELLNSQ